MGLLEPVVLHARQKSVLPLELGVRLRLIARRIDRVALADVAPAVARLGANVIREPPAPLGIHLEMGIGVAPQADGRLQLVAPPVAQPPARQIGPRRRPPPRRRPAAALRLPSAPAGASLGSRLIDLRSSRSFSIASLIGLSS